MKVLIAYASRHGATQGIAEGIGSKLEHEGLEVDVRPAKDLKEVAGYDAFVIGSAAYMFHWLKEATGFVRRNRSLLADRPVWLFSSGPLGRDKVDAKGKDVIAAAEPREFAEFTSAIEPRGLKIFFGAYDPDAKPVGMAERLMDMLPAARDALPAGDFRDWPDVESWAAEIAGALRARTPVAAGT